MALGYLLFMFGTFYVFAVFFFEWYCWYCHEKAESKYSPTQRISKTNRVLFAGPRAKIAEMLDLWLSHAPSFLYRLYQVSVERILPFTWKYLTTKDFVNTTVTDQVIFDALTGGSLITMVKIDESGEKISFQIPTDFVCKTMIDGFCPAGLEIHDY